jgi:hypothetical protein
MWFCVFSSFHFASCLHGVTSCPFTIISCLHTIASYLHIGTSRLQLLPHVFALLIVACMSLLFAFKLLFLTFGYYFLLSTTENCDFFNEVECEDEVMEETQKHPSLQAKKSKVL